uniref:Undecaprenyl/decaprenyl-phosphate alpha-N-acetylglucosaminyl 1-phosphate transferase n=1 Tax=Schlesneria paludicola TaxID=360056 RepID=A0A7C4QMN0_9PLAN
MGIFILGCIGPAFVVAFLTTWLMRWLAPRWGLVDLPAARKVHRVPTPLGGGVGIWCGVLVPLATVQYLLLGYPDPLPAWLPVDWAAHLDGVEARAAQLWGVLAAATVLAIAGLVDDFRPIPWQPRLALQFLVASFVVASGVRGSIFIASPWVGAVLTIGWMVVLVNSFNFLDNMDGLSGGVGLIVSGIFAVMMLMAPGGPRWLVAGFFLVLSGSLLGFLCHNWSPARIFMGDAGSYFVGFSLAAMTVLGTFYTPAASAQHVILAPFCVLAIPLYDLASVVLIRLSEGRSPFQPDKRHFSHRLVAMGLRPVTAVLTVHLATLTTGLGGLVLYFVPTWSAAVIPLAMVACVVLMIAVLEAAPGGNGSA